MSHAVRQQLLVLRMLWFAIASSTVLLPAILLVVPRPAARPEVLMTLIFAGVAVACAVSSFVVPRIALGAALRNLQVATRQEDDPEALPGFGRKSCVAADPDGAALAVLRVSQPSFIISLALSEAIGLFGFTLAFMGVSATESAPFFVVTWLLIGLRFPRLEPVLRVFERERGVRIARSRRAPSS